MPNDLPATGEVLKVQSTSPLQLEFADVMKDSYNITDYGAIPDDNLDDAAAINACAQAAMAAGKSIYVPGGTFDIDSPILLIKDLDSNFVAEPNTITMFGNELHPYWLGSKVSHINCRDLDGFAIGIQLAKGARFTNLYITGQNNVSAYITSNKMIADSDDADWAVDGCRDELHSPHAGILVDPFGESLANGGAAMTLGDQYPGLDDWYNQGSGGSTSVEIDNCRIEKFVCNIGVSVNGDTSNSDHITVRRCRIEQCKVGVGFFQAQCRGNVVEDINCTQTTAYLFDGYSYGSQAGVTPHVRGGVIAGGVKYLIHNKVNSTGSAEISGLFCESLYGIGIASHTVNFTGCQFKGSYGAMPWATSYYTNVASPTKFTGCDLWASANPPDTRALTFQGKGFEFDSCTFDVGPYVPASYGNTEPLQDGAVFTNCWERHLGTKLHTASRDTRAFAEVLNITVDTVAQTGTFTTSSGLWSEGDQLVNGAPSYLTDEWGNAFALSAIGTISLIVGDVHTIEEISNTMSSGSYTVHHFEWSPKRNVFNSNRSPFVTTNDKQIGIGTTTLGAFTHTGAGDVSTFTLDYGVTKTSGTDTGINIVRRRLGGGSAGESNFMTMKDTGTEKFALGHDPTNGTHFRMNDGAVDLSEKLTGDVEDPTDGRGKIWLRDPGTTELMFTDDQGVNRIITTTPDPGTSRYEFTSGDYVQAAYTHENNTTMSAFVAFKDDMAGGNARAIAGQWDANNQKSWLIYLNSSHQLVIYISVDGITTAKQYTVTGEAALNDDAWHSAAFAHVGGVLKVYLDGVLKTPTKTVDLPTATFHLSTHPITLGGTSSNGVATGVYTGQMHGLRITLDEMAASEILQLHNGVDWPVSVLRMKALMDEGTGTVMVDSSGYGNNGTITAADIDAFHTADIASVVVTSDLVFTEKSSVTTPDAGTVRIWAQPDGQMNMTDDAGTTTNLLTHVGPVLNIAGAGTSNPAIAGQVWVNGDNTLKMGTDPPAGPTPDQKYAGPYIFTDNTVATTVTPDPSVDYSYSYWIKPTDLGNVTHPEQYPIGTQNNASYGIHLSNAGDTFEVIHGGFVNGTNALRPYNTGLALSDDVWTHMTHVWDVDTNTLTIFKDGVEFVGANVTMTAPTTWGTPIYLGRRRDSASTEQFIGEMADFQWFEQELTPTEVAEVYSNPRTGSVRPYSTVFNVKDYGAEGELDEIDDLAEIQAAIDAIVANGGGTLYFPAGTYNVSGPMILPTNTMVLGEGYNSHIRTMKKNWNDQPINLGIFVLEAAGQSDNVSFESIRIDGRAQEIFDDPAIDTTTLGGAAPGTPGLPWDASNCPKMIYAKQTAGQFDAAINVRVENCWIMNSGNEGVWGGARKAIVKNCFATGCGMGVISSWDALPALQFFGVQCMYLNNYCEGNGSDIGATAEQPIVIGNYCKNTKLNAISCGDGGLHEACIIANNYVELGDTGFDRRRVGIALIGGRNDLDPTAIHGGMSVVSGNYILLDGDSTDVQTIVGIQVTTPGGGSAPDGSAAGGANIFGNTVEIRDSGLGFWLTNDGADADTKYILNNNVVFVKDESATKAVSAFVCEANDNFDVLLLSRNNAVLGMVLDGGIHYAYDYKAKVGTTSVMNAIVQNDYTELGGNIRYNYEDGGISKLYFAGELTNVPIYLTIDPNTETNFYDKVRSEQFEITQPIGVTFIGTGSLSALTAGNYYGRMQIRGEGGSSADDLDTITDGTVGNLLLLQSWPGTTITVKHNTGNIHLSGGVDQEVSDNHRILLDYDGTNWIQVGAAGAAGHVTKVGTPVDNQIGVWTGDGTIEGDPDLTFDGVNIGIGAPVSSGVSDHTWTTAGKTNQGVIIDDRGLTFKREVGGAESAGVKTFSVTDSSVQLQMEASDNFQWYSSALAQSIMSLSRSAHLATGSDGYLSVKSLQAEEFPFTANIAPSFVSDDAAASAVGMIMGRTNRSVTLGHSIITYQYNGSTVGNLTTNGSLLLGPPTTPDTAMVLDLKQHNDTEYSGIRVQDSSETVELEIGFNGIQNDSAAGLDILATGSDVHLMATGTGDDVVIEPNATGETRVVGDLNVTGAITSAAYAEMSCESNVTTTTFSASSTDFTNASQITVFDTNGLAQNATVDHTNDHITIAAGHGGRYLVSISMSISGSANNTISWAVFKNNKATKVGIRGTRQIGTGGDVGNVAETSIADLSAGDTVEVWIQNEDATTACTVEDAVLTLTKL